MADACCAVDLGELETAAIYHRSEVRARKSHACDECNRAIQVGDTYTRVEMLADSHWSHWKTCGFCEALVRDYCGGVLIHGGLADILWDCLDYDLVNDRWRDDP